MPTDRLVPLLADLQLAEGLLEEIPVLVRDSIKTVYYDHVLAEHQFSHAAFDSLLWIVRREPEWVLAVFTQVSDELARREAEAQRVPQPDSTTATPQ